MFSPQTKAEFLGDFEGLVREGIPDLAEQEDSWFDRNTGPTRQKIVLYGMGSLGRLLLKGLQKMGQPPIAIADERLSLQQAEIEGIPCLSPANACKSYGLDSIFVVAIFNQTGGKAFAEIKAGLSSFGAKRVVYFLPFFWKHADVFLPYYSLDLPSNFMEQRDEILRIYQLLTDDQSRIDFAWFFYHLLCPHPILTCPVTDHDTYFPRDVLPLGDQETFLDGGAFSGDTLARFVEKTNGCFVKYIGVEPDPTNLKALEERIAKMQGWVTGTLETRNSAIGFQAAELAFEASGQLGSALAPSGNIIVKVQPLIDLLKGTVPTYIKLDIEGAELDALKGGKALLTETKPKLAVCVYHRPSHFWQIPALMHEINPGYKLFFRRHCEYLDDVVAYAVPA